MAPYIDAAGDGYQYRQHRLREEDRDNIVNLAFTDGNIMTNPRDVPQIKEFFKKGM